jgi:hypothetical protein
MEAHRSEFMGTRRSRCPAWFRVAQPERETANGNNELRTDLFFIPPILFLVNFVNGEDGERKILRATPTLISGLPGESLWVPLE